RKGGGSRAKPWWVWVKPNIFSFLSVSTVKENEPLSDGGIHTFLLKKKSIKRKLLRETLFRLCFEQVCR
ncbi:MAG: hypothetical protein K2N78_05060, partial [Oscillospiraceae bacterium]|nr:hypothetical protein [Oscillospiraceae bacterium]